MPKQKAEVNLSLLKDLVSNLETTMETYKGIDQKTELNKYIVELAKAAGIAAGIMQEASALVGDFHSLVRISQGIGSKKGIDMTSLEDLFGLKGDPGDPNAN